MRALFFGDSLTEGTNCDCNYTEFLPGGWAVHNLAVSGTTIGDYSIYPVDGNSLLDKIRENKNLVALADTIFIEYGTNDISAVMCGFTTTNKIVISLVKALDWIKQLNPNANIVFLIPSEDDDILKSLAEAMCDYLEKDYFKQFHFSFPVNVYVNFLRQLLDDIQKLCTVMPMFDRGMIDCTGEIDKKYMSDDNIHPNRYGHLRIARNIIESYHF